MVILHTGKITSDKRGEFSTRSSWRLQVQTKPQTGLEIPGFYGSTQMVSLTYILSVDV